MKQKEKEKLFFGNKSAKRLVFVVLFLCVFSFSFNNFRGFNKVHAESENISAEINDNVKNSQDYQDIEQQEGKVLGTTGAAIGTAAGIIGGPVTMYLGNKVGDVAGDVVGKIVGDKIVKKAKDTASSGLLWVFNALLYAVFKLVGAVVVIAGNIFDWAVDAKNFRIVMNLDSIEKGWKMVRDFLNLFFILILLFSAFCTIFQVTKYHIKTILLNLVIMALLVNFSYPISRAIIDAGNIPMYYFFQNIRGNIGNSVSKTLWNNTNGNNAGLQKMLLPDINNFDQVNGTGDQTFSLIAAIIFLFIFGLTLLVIAVLFVIRMIVLAILVIFSPVGFVAAIFPGFSKYSSSWWEQLFKQSFFGTVMAFMVYISLLIMEESQKSVIRAMADFSTSEKNSMFGTVVVSGVTLVIPIVLLWIGILSAKNMGAFGAEAVVGRATKVAKWAGKKFSGYSAAKRQYDAFAAQRKKREDEKAKNRIGVKLGDKINDAQDKILAHGNKDSKAGKRYNKRKDLKNKEDIKNKSEEYDGTTEAALHTDIKGMSGTAVAAMGDNQVKEAAGKVKQALSRGATYEKHVENDLRSQTAGTAGLTGIKPPDIVYASATITTGMTPAQVAIEQEREKKEKAALDEWIRDEKAALMDQARAVIKEAENRGKIA